MPSVPRNSRNLTMHLKKELDQNRFCSQPRKGGDCKFVLQEIAHSCTDKLPKERPLMRSNHECYWRGQRGDGSMEGLLEDVIKVGRVMGFKMEESICKFEELIGTQGEKKMLHWRILSDHRPILLKENGYDYGPTPFRFFRSLLFETVEMDGLL
ncbi:hypothetical protein Tco_0808231 [Tanacetum coccineum]